MTTKLSFARQLHLFSLVGSLALHFSTAMAEENSDWFTKPLAPLPEGTQSFQRTSKLDLTAEISGRRDASEIDELLNAERLPVPLPLESLQQWDLVPNERSGTPGDESTIWQEMSVAMQAVAAFKKQSNGSIVPKGDALEASADGDRLVASAVISDSGRADRSAQPIKQADPRLPREYRNIVGHVAVKVGVSNRGRVTAATAESFSHEELVEPALLAAREWRFEPSLRQGEAIASSYTIPFRFSEASKRFFNTEVAIEASSSEIESKPLAILSPLPELARLSGNPEIRVRTYIDEYGYVAQVEVVESPSPEIRTAIESALYRWKFNPGRRQGQPVATVQTLNFIADKGALTLKAESFDCMPEPLLSPKPRLSRALRSSEGYVLVHMRIDPSGKVVSAQVLESTNEKLEKPTIEAALGWEFRPGEKNGRKVESTIVIPFVYPEENRG